MDTGFRPANANQPQQPAPLHICQLALDNIKQFKVKSFIRFKFRLDVIENITDDNNHHYNGTVDPIAAGARLVQSGTAQSPLAGNVRSGAPGSQAQHRLDFAQVSAAQLDALLGKVNLGMEFFFQKFDHHRIIKF